MRVYIAGPMTGLPEFNFPAFHAAADAWRAVGWDVCNPADAFDGVTDHPYGDYVAHDMKLLQSCDAIAMLPGWDGPTARGSVWEREIARMLGLAVYDATAPVQAEYVAPKSQPETILEEAQRLVHGDRQAAYSHPIDDYTRTGRMWGAILGIPDVDPRLCCLMMAVVKVSRETHKHKRDNLTDLAGYAECAQLVADRQEASPSPAVESATPAESLSSAPRSQEATRRAPPEIHHTPTLGLPQAGWDGNEDMR